jgi:hypothetical protein
LEAEEEDDFFCPPDLVEAESAALGGVLLLLRGVLEVKSIRIYAYDI